VANVDEYDELRKHLGVQIPDALATGEVTRRRRLVFNTSNERSPLVAGLANFLPTFFSLVTHTKQIRAILLLERARSTRGKELILITQRDTTAENILEHLSDIERYPDIALTSYEEFSTGGRIYYFTPGGFLYRKDPGAEEVGGFFCGYLTNEVWHYRTNTAQVNQLGAA